MQLAHAESHTSNDVAANRRLRNAGVPSTMMPIPDLLQSVSSVIFDDTERPIG